MVIYMKKNAFIFVSIQMFHNFNSKDFFLGSPVEQLA